MITHLAYKFDVLKSQCLLYSGSIYDALYFDNSYNLAFKPNGKNLCRFKYKSCTPQPLEYDFLRALTEANTPKVSKQEINSKKETQEASQMLSTGEKKDKQPSDQKVDGTKEENAEIKSNQPGRRTQLFNDNIRRLPSNSGGEIGDIIQDEKNKWKISESAKSYMLSFADQEVDEAKSILDNGLMKEERADRVTNSNIDQSTIKYSLHDRRLANEDKKDRLLPKIHLKTEESFPVNDRLHKKPPELWSICHHTPMKEAAATSKSFPDCSLGQVYNSFVDFYGFVKYFLTYAPSEEISTPMGKSHQIRFKKYYNQTVHDLIDEMRDLSWQHFMDAKTVPISLADSDAFYFRLYNILEKGLDVYFEMYPFNSDVVTASVEKEIMKNISDYMASQSRYHYFERFIELEKFKQRQRDIRVIAGEEASDNPDAYLKVADDYFKHSESPIINEHDSPPKQRISGDQKLEEKNQPPEKYPLEENQPPEKSPPEENK